MVESRAGAMRQTWFGSPRRGARVRAARAGIHAPDASRRSADDRGVSRNEYGKGFERRDAKREATLDERARVERRRGRIERGDYFCRLGDRTWAAAVGRWVRRPRQQECETTSSRKVKNSAEMSEGNQAPQIIGSRMREQELGAAPRSGGRNKRVRRRGQAKRSSGITARVHWPAASREQATSGIHASTACCPIRAFHWPRTTSSPDACLPSESLAAER